MNSISGEGKPSGSRLASSKSPTFLKVYTIGDDLLEKCSPIVNAKKTKLPLKGNRLERRKRNPWTQEEDDELMRLIKIVCPVDDGLPGKLINFNQIARSLGSGRTGKQCRDRWTNFLRSGIKKGDWTPDEIELIRDMYSTFGPKWSAMAKLFKDRTDNDIKNKWYSMKRMDERNKSKAVQRAATEDALSNKIGAD